MRLLIESGAKFDLCDKKVFRPFHYACKHGRVDVVLTLLKNGANCVEPTLHTHDTPLHLAVQFNNNTVCKPGTERNSLNSIEAIVLLILANGGHMSLNIINKTHQLTAFELACELGKTRIVESILKYCSENFLKPSRSSSQNSAVNSPNRRPISLLELIRKYSADGIHLASRNGHDDIIRLLLIYSVADINKVSDKFQGTALHEACRHGRCQTVKLLLEVSYFKVCLKK